MSRADLVWCMTAIDWGWGIKATAAKLMEKSTKAKENGERYALLTAQNAGAAVAQRQHQTLLKRFSGHQDRAAYLTAKSAWLFDFSAQSTNFRCICTRANKTLPMLKPTLDYLPKSKTANILFWILVTLVLGALGSGLWEKVFSPLFGFFGRFLVTCFTFFSASYSDSLHRRISRDGIHALTFLPFLVLSSLTLIVPWWPFIYINMQIIRVLRLKNKFQLPTQKDPNIIKNKIDRTLVIIRRLRWFGLSVAVLSTVLYGHEGYQATYTRSAAVFVERSLDILAPSLSDLERLSLRARYRAIENASDFGLLYDELKQQSAKHSIKLPEFEPILRPTKP